jgi:hypothetical protein
LSNIDNLIVSACPVTSLEGLNGMSLQFLRLRYCSSLSGLSGIPHLSALKSLELIQCGVTSLQPLSQLGEGLEELRVIRCSGVQEKVLELAQVQTSAAVVVAGSSVREVVLAGGVRRAVESD